MIFKDRCKFHHVQVCGGRANGLESSVVWCENSDIPSRVKSVDQICLGQGASNGAETGLFSSVGDVLGDRQDSVDDMDDSACEVDILFDVS